MMVCYFAVTRMTVKCDQNKPICESPLKSYPMLINWTNKNWGCRGEETERQMIKYLNMK
jgi:hypothetical protein